MAKPKRVIKIGLTGSYAMGKSTAAGLLRAGGVPVHDADAAVHALLAKGGKGVAKVAQHFPHALTEDSSIDRKKLGDTVFADSQKRVLLESLVHPLVQDMRAAWLASQQKHASNKAQMLLVVFDIPLLFETGKEVLCDYVAVVSAPAWVQKTRALARPNMTANRFTAILNRQLADSEKRQRADYILPSQFGMLASTWYIDRMLADIRLREGHA